jgi:pimeloyl-ACP methyl ester carboxylesterase
VLVWATHFAPDADLFNHNAPCVEWRDKPSWWVLGKQDQTVHPELQKFASERMGAKVFPVDSSHVPMLSHPDFVVDVIRQAAKAIEAASVASGRRVLTMHAAAGQRVRRTATA